MQHLCKPHKILPATNKELCMKKSLSIIKYAVNVNMKDEQSRTQHPKRSRSCIGRLCYWYVVSTAVSIKLIPVPAVLVVEGFTSLNVNFKVRRLVYSCWSDDFCLESRLKLQLKQQTEDEYKGVKSVQPCENNPSYSISRRNAFRSLGSAAVNTLIVATGVLSPDVVNAARAEFDSTTGNLFTPKADMLSGGSDAARGLPISRNRIARENNIVNAHIQRSYVY